MAILPTSTDQAEAELLRKVPPDSSQWDITAAVIIFLRVFSILITLICVMMAGLMLVLVARRPLRRYYTVVRDKMRWYWYTYTRNFRKAERDSEPQSEEVLASDTTPPRLGTVIRKKIEQLSPKRILGLDNASYLRRLPTDSAGQGLDLTLNPVHVAPQFNKLTDAPCKDPIPDLDEVARTGVGPMDMERRLNPVFFSYLLNPPAAPESKGNSLGDPYDRTYLENCPAESSMPPRWRTEYVEISASQGTTHSIASTATDDSSSTLSPATTNSTMSLTEKGKSPAKEPQTNFSEAFELTTFAAIIPGKLPEDLAVQIDPLPPAAASPISTLPATHSGDTRNTDFQCSKCSMTFRLPSLLRNHENRKHNLRYICSLCDAAFGLRADLERHRVTRHSKELGLEPKKVFKCPNAECLTPGKKYLRKDNFVRHTRRCKKAKVRHEVMKPGGKE